MADIYIGNVKGPQGATGATGAQGPQGDAATIEVGTVSTTAYGNTAQVINTGTSSEAVFDFVIPQGRPGEETTTMSSLTLDTVTAQSAQYPVPATGESGSVVFGKIIKFFNDVKSAIVNKINYSDCVYNLTSTSNTLPLAASQGKALNDALANKASTASVSALTAYSSATFTILTQVTSTVHENAIYKYGHICFGKCRMSATGSGDWVSTAEIFQAPAGFRPAMTFGCSGYEYITTGSAGLTPVQVTINSAGKVGFSYSNSARTTQFAFVGVWWVE